MWSTVTLIFNGVGLVLLFQFIRYKFNQYKNEPIKSNYWTFKRHPYVITISTLVIASYLIIELVLPEHSPIADDVSRYNLNFWFGVLISFLISANWAFYLRKLDVFEPESWLHIFLVFAMGAITVWLVFPISGFLRTEVGFRLNGSAFNDFMYSTIAIGMVEEFVKMIPLIIIIRFRNIVNEPFDYLLYASVSALGFAFIENALYIQRTDFYAINGRALMSTVAHMTFSSVIGYAFMISACKLGWRGWYYVVGGFVLASVMHGFYDFWLISAVAQKFNGLSFLFFMLTVHFWFTMKSKAINASYFFDESLYFSNRRVRYYLVISLVSLLAISALLIALFHGRNSANVFLSKQIFAYGFLVYYLIFSFSKFRIAPKALDACQVVFEKAIPQEPDPQDSWEKYHQQKHW